MTYDFSHLQSADEERTVSWLARQIGIPRSVLSAYASAFEFWGEHHEEIPLGVSWHGASMARQRVGWRPGQAGADDLLSKGFGLLEAWMDRAPKQAKGLADEQKI